MSSKKILFSITLVLALSSAKIAAAQVLIKSSPNAARYSYDVQFIDSMVAHDRQQIEVAKVALARSHDFLIKQRMNDMIGALQAEIMKLQSIRNHIHRTAPPAINMNIPGMKIVDLTDLKSLTGHSFDKEFLELIITQETNGLQMSSTAATEARNVQVKEMALEISNRQTTSLGELQPLADQHR